MYWVPQTENNDLSKLFDHNIVLKNIKTKLTKSIHFSNFVMTACKNCLPFERYEYDKIVGPNE